MGKGVGDPASLSFTLTVDQPPTAASAASATVDDDVPMAPFTIDYSGFPAPTLSAKGLPKGLTLISSGNGTAAISGIPALKDSGAYTAAITAKSKAGTSVDTVIFYVDTSPVFTSKAAVVATAGDALDYPITTEYGYPYTTIDTDSPLPSDTTLTDTGPGTAQLKRDNWETQLVGLGPSS